MDKVIPINKRDQLDIEETFRQALAEAKEKGITKAAIVLLDDRDGMYCSKTFATSSLKSSETVALLTIAVDDIIMNMRQ